MEKQNKLYFIRNTVTYEVISFDTEDSLAEYLELTVPQLKGILAHSNYYKQWLIYL